MRDLVQQSASESGSSADGGVAPGKTSRAARIYRKGGGAVGGGADAAVEAAAGSTGSPLPEGPRARFETSLGTDLGGVRIHTGGASASAAGELSARAYTVGNDIHFGAGQYQPNDPFGMHLLGHEVAHTVQQRGGGGGPQTKLEVSDEGDAHEAEADRAADAMVRGAPATVSTGPVGIHRFGFGGAIGSVDIGGSIGSAGAAGGGGAVAGGGGGALKMGSQGPAVEELQRQLTAAGCACGAIDGQFGPATRAAVVSFQRAHGLAADGVVGPMTHAALSSAPATPAAGPAPAAGGATPAPAPAAGGAAPAPAAGGTHTPAPAATPGVTPAAPDHAVAPDKTQNPADKTIANPTRQSIVSAARSKIGSVFSDVSGGADETGDQTRKGWESLTEIFDVAFPEFPKKIIKYTKYGKNNGGPDSSPNGLVSWCGIFATWAVKTGGGNCGTWQGGPRVSSMSKVTSDPKPGDVGYFTAHAHHCIIAAVDGDRIETIDGNSFDAEGGNGAITSRWRSRKDFQAFFRQVED